MNEKAVPGASPCAPEPSQAHTEDRPDVPLTLLAHLLEFHVNEASFEENLLPWLDDCQIVQERLAELEALERRYCHPLPTSLVYELHSLERHLRYVLESPVEIDVVLEHLEHTLGGHQELLATWSLCMRLCESCIDIAARDPERGVLVARAARAIAQDLSPHDFSDAERQQLEALTWAHEANAHRIPGHLRQAQKCFEQVRALRQYEVPKLAGLWAEIRWLEITVLRDSRQLPQARAAAEAAIELAEYSGRLEFAAGALLSLASLDYEEGELETAVERTRQAVAQLDPAQHPRWYAEACFNVANYLCRAGDGAAALEHVARHKSTIRLHCSPGDLARLPWMEGASLRALGRFEEAATKYDEARRAFLELGRGFYVALVTLELAILHLEQGHTAEVKRLAAEILPVFEMQGIDREARATLELFRQAVAAEQITLLQLRGWLGRLGA